MRGWLGGSPGVAGGRGRRGSRAAGAGQAPLRPRARKGGAAELWAAEASGLLRPRPPPVGREGCPQARGDPRPRLGWGFSGGGALAPGGGPRGPVAPGGGGVRTALVVAAGNEVILCRRPPARAGGRGPPGGPGQGARGRHVTGPAALADA